MDQEMAQQLKGTRCSCRELGFSPQHPLGGLQLTVMAVPGDPGLSCPLQEPGMHEVVHTSRQDSLADPHRNRVRRELEQYYWGDGTEKKMRKQGRLATAQVLISSCDKLGGAFSHS